MRTIKFRGKRVDSGEWVYGHYALDHQSDPTIIQYPPRSAFFRHKVLPETVGQFTGLLDKNGNEVWEGDTFKSPYNHVYDFAIYSIKWDNKNARFWTDCLALHHKEDGFKDISNGGYCTVGLSNDKMSKLEIIGNIHDK